MPVAGNLALRRDRTEVTECPRCLFYSGVRFLTLVCRARNRPFGDTEHFLKPTQPDCVCHIRESPTVAFAMCFETNMGKMLNNLDCPSWVAVAAQKPSVGEIDVIVRICHSVG